MSRTETTPRKATPHRTAAGIRLGSALRKIQARNLAARKVAQVQAMIRRNLAAQKG